MLLLIEQKQNQLTVIFVERNKKYFFVTFVKKNPQLEL